LGDPGVDGRKILKRISGKRSGRYVLGSAGSGQGQVAVTCECGNELSGVHKIQRISLLAENRLASEKGLCSME
jgi:hypothetical protein